MSHPEPVKPVKPILAVFSADRLRLASAAGAFEERWGRVDYIGEELCFDQTRYYGPEMGGPLYKRLLAAEPLMDPTALVDLKEWAWEREAEWSVDGKRTVNLDPGYVSVLHLILATGKPAAHRVYLGRRVWADLTLIYQSGGFKPLPWSYADFSSDPMRAAAADIRRRCLEQLKSHRLENVV